MLTLNKILVPTDFSGCAEQALDHAVFMARRRHASLFLLHVVPLPALDLPHLREEFYVTEKDAAEDRMRVLLERRETADLEVRLDVRPGQAATPAAPVILDYARQHEVDLIVLGTHGRRGVRRLLLGSVAEEIVHAAPCPVFAVRERAEAFPRRKVTRILVPLDLSEQSRRALPYATAFAASHGARLLLLTVRETFPVPGIYGVAMDPAPGLALESEAIIRESLEKIAAEVEQAGTPVEPMLSKGYPPGVILDVAAEHDVDLIVMASHGRTGLDRFSIGGVTEKVLRQSPCPVFIVRSSDGAR